MDPLDQPLGLAPDVVFQVIKGEALILKLDDEQVFALNETGARIAELITQGHRVDAVAAALSAEFGVARDRIDAEVRALVQSLVSRGLLIPVGTGARP